MKHILIPELVPLANRGEEAIVRGIADVLFPDGNCELHLFDEVNEYRFDRGIHVYPVKWFISPWLNREFGLGLSWEKIRDSACSLARNGLHYAWPSWVRKPCLALERTSTELRRLAVSDMSMREGRVSGLERLINVDYIVAGHDGALDERVCQVIELFLGLGKRFGVFGVELPTQFKSSEIVALAHKTLLQSDFFFCRTRASAAVVAENFPGVPANVLPDPAFGMKAATSEEIDSLLREHRLTQLFERPVVVCTSCEPAPISRYCFECTRGPKRKLEAHRKLIAELVAYIVEHYDANILLLPHALGPGRALDDRVIATDILRRSGIPPTRGVALNVGLPARVLKGIMGQAEFLIAERVHSMIGAVGVGTPFLCLGSKTDRRIDGIVRDMIGAGENIYYLNSPSLESLIESFNRAWHARHEMRMLLNARNATLLRQLETAASVMRERIQSAQVGPAALAQISFREA